MTDTKYRYQTPYYRSTPRNARPNRQWIESNEKAVYVVGFPRYVQREEFYEWFKQFGYVKRFDLPRGVDSENKGFGYVHFETKEQAEALIEQKTCLFRNYTLTFASYTNQRNQPRMDPDEYHSMLTSQVETYAQISSNLPAAYYNNKDIDLLSLCSSGFITEQATQVQNSRSRSPDNSIIEHIEVNDVTPTLAPQVSVEARHVSQEPRTPNEEVKTGSNPSHEEINKAVTELAQTDCFKIVEAPSNEPLFTIQDFDKMIFELQQENTELSPRSQVMNKVLTDVLAECVTRKTIAESYEISIDSQLVSDYFLAVRNIWPTGTSTQMPIDVLG